VETIYSSRQVYNSQPNIALINDCHNNEYLLEDDECIDQWPEDHGPASQSLDSSQWDNSIMITSEKEFMDKYMYFDIDVDAYCKENIM